MKIPGGVYVFVRDFLSICLFISEALGRTTRPISIKQFVDKCSTPKAAVRRRAKHSETEQKHNKNTKRENSSLTKTSLGFGWALSNPIILLPQFFFSYFFLPSV